MLVAPARLSERIFRQTPQGAEAIFPADLFSFFVGASPIADADFVDAQAALGDLYRDFRLETEAVLFDGNRLDDLSAENFVTGFHVAEIHVGERVGKQRENPVADRVPKIKHAMRSSAEEARSVNHIGLALDERAEQLRIFGGIVFEIGI